MRLEKLCECMANFKLWCELECLTVSCVENVRDVQLSQESEVTRETTAIQSRFSFDSLRHKTHLPLMTSC